MPMFQVDSEESFNTQVLQNKELVMCGFTAAWCPPCKVLAPKIQEMAQQLPNLNICRIDVDKAETVSEKYDIMTIPTLAFFKDGELKDKLMIADKTPEAIMQFIQTNMQKFS